MVSDAGRWLVASSRQLAPNSQFTSKDVSLKKGAAGRIRYDDVWASEKDTRIPAAYWFMNFRTTPAPVWDPVPYGVDPNPFYV